MTEPAARLPAPNEESMPRSVRLSLRDEWSGRGRGLLSSDPRIRTLRKVLVTYPAVRHIRPDRVSLDPATDRRVLDTVARFLERQHWLVTAVVIE